MCYDHVAGSLSTHTIKAFTPLALKFILNALNCYNLIGSSSGFSSKELGNVFSCIFFQIEKEVKED